MIVTQAATSPFEVWFIRSGNEWKGLEINGGGMVPMPDSDVGDAPVLRA